uniref:Uncharacterized protein n=1 Tax=Oryza sativa subsp. japonica TaxID=39947 RepID=Q69K09_ORYSJ|nr:unknown protein [Oryza sativa Japonica Group]
MINKSYVHLELSSPPPRPRVGDTGGNPSAAAATLSSSPSPRRRRSALLENRTASRDGGGEANPRRRPVSARGWRAGARCKADDAAWRQWIRRRCGRIRPPRGWIRWIHAGFGRRRRRLAATTTEPEAAGGWRRRREPEAAAAGGWRPPAKEAGACRGRGGDGEAMVAEAVEDGAGRRGWRPTRAEAADGDTTGGCGGRRTGRRGWRPACVEAAVAATAEAAVATAAEARSTTAEGDVAQLPTGDGCTARRIGGGVCPLAVAACRRKMATLDGRVRGRGDPFFSLTLSLSNPTTWMDVKRGEG